jgi:hypothetical protein
LNKYIVLLLVLSSFLFGQRVVVATKVIQYKAKITKNDVQEIEYTRKISRSCEPVTSVEYLLNDDYRVTHYISKGRIICQKDVKAYVKKTVIFNFGSFEIEKEGEVIFENGSYVKIRRPDGRVEKIYKNGAVR